MRSFIHWAGVCGRQRLARRARVRWTARYVETHVLLLTPVIVSLLARAGYSKHGVASYLMKKAAVPAHYFEWSMLQADHHTPDTTLSGLVEKGELPQEWRVSDDPDRLVPLMLPQSQWLIVVAGDPLRGAL